VADGERVVAGDLKELARKLYERRAEAVVVPYEDREGSDWKPSERDCHNNVDRWVLENPDTRSVRGWIVFDFEKTSRGLMPMVRFTPHSVVEEADGRLVDITPSKASQRYPFLPHADSDGSFEEIVTANQLENLDYDTAAK
jgi:hypothetical protein